MHKRNEQSLKHIWLVFNQKTSVLEYLRLSGMKRNLVEATASWHNLFFLAKFHNWERPLLRWDLITCRCGPFLVSTKKHQWIQAPNFWGFPEPYFRLFRRWGFPYIGRIHTAYIGEGFSILGTWNVCWKKGTFFVICQDLLHLDDFLMVQMFRRKTFSGCVLGATPLGVCELWIVGAKSFIREGAQR